MAWIARDKDGQLYIYSSKPTRHNIIWIQGNTFCEVSKKADESLMGRHITWEDEPVEI